MANRLETAWEEHAKENPTSVFGNNLTNEDDRKKAFFAGARALLNGLMVDSTPDEETDTADVVQEYVEELAAFDHETELADGD